MAVPYFNGDHGVWLSVPRPPSLLLLFLIPWKTKMVVIMVVHVTVSSVISISQEENGPPGHI